MMQAPQTVAELLGGDDPYWIERALHEAQVAQGALAQAGRLAAAVFPAFEQRVGEALRSALDVDLHGVVVAGWLRYRDLVAAGERTRAAPGSREDVVLAEHEISSTHPVTVEVMLDGRTVATLEFDATVNLTLHGVVAVVTGGMLVGLRFGDVVAGAQLSLWDRELVAREVRCIVGALVHVGRGIALVPGIEGAASVRIPHQRHPVENGSTAVFGAREQR